MMTVQSSDRTPQRLLDDQIEPFLNQLQEAGYAQRTLRKKRTVARAFAQWAKENRIAARDLDASHIAAFVGRSPRRRKARMKFELAVMRLFFGYLRREARLPSTAQKGPDSAAG